MNAVYRAVLKCYPRWWRDQHGDEALGLLLDSADARGRIDSRDLFNLVLHAARLRLGNAGPPTFVQGLRNRLSVIAVSLLAAICSTFLVFGEWAPWDPRSSLAASPVGNLTTGSICFAAGLLAAIAMTLGRPTAARCLAALSALSALAIMAPPVEQLADSFGFTRPPGALLAFAAVIGALATIGEPLRPRGSRGLFALLAAAPSIGTVTVTALTIQPEPWFFYRLPDEVALRVIGGGLLGIALLVVAVVLLIGGSRVWAAALAVNSLPWLMLLSFVPFLGDTSVLPTSGAVLLAMVIALALLVGMAAVTLNRRFQPARNSVSRSE